MTGATPAISVIVTVYKQSKFFRLCLQSLVNQTFRDFEVIVADDGSGKEVEDVVSEFRAFLKIKHVWQEDLGFRKALVLNKAAKTALSDKLFFIDGDILVHPRGVEVVSEALGPGRYITSRVVRISQRLRDRILGGGYSVRKIFSFSFFVTLVADWIFGKTRVLEYGLMLPPRPAAFFQSLKKSKQVFGGCWAICKSDFELVNGYDNSYIGYGHEDFDISWRLHWAGIAPKLVTNRLVMFHLYHTKRQENLENKKKKLKAKINQKSRCENGLAELPQNPYEKKVIGVSEGHPVISVLIAVYNKTDYLRYCLESLRLQTYKDFEIVIADDGSGPEVKHLVDEYRKYFNIKHVWQEDKNFRKCLILNKAVKASSGDKLFFFDGDVVVHPRYLECSQEYIIKGQYMISRSVYLSEVITSKIFKQKITVPQIFGAAFFLVVMKNWIFGKTWFFEYGIFLTEGLSKIVSSLKKDKHIFGRCWAVHRNDYEKINGYNNDFVGAYYEDFEITVRLNFAGVKPVLLIDRAVSWHLFHNRVSMEPQNLDKYRRIKEFHNFRCSNGLDNIEE